MEQCWINPFALNGHENTLKIVAQEQGINADELIKKIEETASGYLETTLTEDEIQLLKVCRFDVQKVSPDLFRIRYDFGGELNQKAGYSKNL